MPHLRKRHVEGHVGRLLKHSPIVALFGHRQVGKTSLASLFTQNDFARYFTLDVRSTYDRIRSDPLSFLERQSQTKGCIVIDEAQMMPELFPALKEHVRRHPRPGQFLITGSVRFSSRAAIRESLTGRYIAQELLPFDANERYGGA